MVCDAAASAGAPVVAFTQQADSSVAVFLKQWHSYQSALQNNCLRHKEMMGAVQQHLEHCTQGPLDILDCGSGDSEPIAIAIGSSPELQARLASYTGIDLSPMAIEIGQRNIAAVVQQGCRVQYVEADMLHHVCNCQQRYDAVLASFSLHHLPLHHKRQFVSAVASLLRPGGVFLLVDIFLQEGQSREGYLQVYQKQMADDWTGMSAQQIADIRAHVVEHDFPVELSTYQAWAAADGTFVSVKELASLATYKAVAMRAA